MFAIILAIFVIAICFYYYQMYEKQWKYIDKIPGPKTIPIFGNAIQIGFSPVEYTKSLMTWFKEYGSDIFRVYIGYAPYVIIGNPKDVEYILTSNTLIQKGDVYNMLHPWIGEGLLTSTGQKWFKHRKMITPSFHFKILVDFLDVMIKSSNNLTKHLSSKAKTGELFDIQEVFHYCTLDVICETAMGTEINAMNNNNSALVAAFQDMCYVIQQRMFSIIKRSDFLFRFTNDYKIQQRALGILKDFTMDVIEKRRIYLENLKNLDENQNQSDEFSRKKLAFLDTLLTATIDGRPLNDKEVFEEVSTFMFEGHDTTSSGVTFCSFILSRHPNIQQKVFEEQKTIFGNDMKRNPTYQEMQDMKYLEMVIKESQRFYPSVPMMARYAFKDFNMGGTIIPKGVTVSVYILAMNYNEKYFKDPFKFDPERFSQENSVGRNPYEYVPFSAGPRNCIGQKFAMLEMKSIISNIVRNYEILPPNADCIRKDNYEKIDLSNKYDPILASVLTLKSDNGIHVKIKARA